MMSRKVFTKKFLYEPFPVESSLQQALHDHINAEIVTGTITNRQKAVEYLTWTFMFRRLVRNPSYYGLEDNSYQSLNKWLSELVNRILEDLENAGCVRCLNTIPTAKANIEPTSLGTIASFYYLSYISASFFDKNVREDSSVEHLLQLLCEAKEFEEIPVRHNEDKLNQSLCEHVSLRPYNDDMESPHIKTFLLLQAHFDHVKMPIIDYDTDLKTVLDSTIRIIQAYVDIAAEKGYLSTVLNLILLLQMIMQAQWYYQPSMNILPGVQGQILKLLARNGVEHLSQFINLTDQEASKLLKQANMSASQIEKVISVKQMLPLIDISISSIENEEEFITVNVDIVRRSKTPDRGYTPYFKKSVYEGYWAIIGDLNSGSNVCISSEENEDLAAGDLKYGELLAIKRIRIGQETCTDLMIPVDKKGKKLTFFLMSDMYIGLDQQIDFIL
jgi:activating signal cointegrator complex subunit 3